MLVIITGCTRRPPQWGQDCRSGAGDSEARCGCICTLRALLQVDRATTVMSSPQHDSSAIGSGSQSLPDTDVFLGPVVGRIGLQAPCVVEAEFADQRGRVKENRAHR